MMWLITLPNCVIMIVQAVSSTLLLLLLMILRKYCTIIITLPYLILSCMT